MKNVTGMRSVHTAAISACLCPFLFIPAISPALRLLPSHRGLSASLRPSCVLHVQRTVRCLGTFPLLRSLSETQSPGRCQRPGSRASSSALNLALIARVMMRIMMRMSHYRFKHVYPDSPRSLSDDDGDLAGLIKDRLDWPGPRLAAEFCAPVCQCASPSREPRPVSAAGVSAACPAGVSARVPSISSLSAACPESAAGVSAACPAGVSAAS
jgi:hypothetical protein